MSELGDPGLYAQSKQQIPESLASLEDADSQDIASFNSIAVRENQKVTDADLNLITLGERYSYSLDTKMYEGIRALNVPEESGRIQLQLDNNGLNNHLERLVDHINEAKQMKKDAYANIQEILRERKEVNSEVDFSKLSGEELKEAIRKQSDQAIQTAQQMYEANAQMKYAIIANKWISAIAKATVNLVKSIISGQ